LTKFTKGSIKPVTDDQFLK